MLSESLFLSSFYEIKNLLLHELTILHIAIVYVLMYVVYKALGRYVYFKPQEHASKVNRTFLTLSLFIILLNSLHIIINYLPLLSEHRLFFAICTLVILVAPLSIITDRLIWKYHRFGGKGCRNWHYDYLPIKNDYYKIATQKSERISNSESRSYEVEEVESTKKISIQMFC